MNKYIAILSVGPVQSFIASARKTRDLWSGSWLLSELSKAGAKSFNEQKATLIFPYVNDIKLLDENSPFSVVNKIQVQITAENEQELTTILETAKKAINTRFIDEVKLVRKRLSNNHIRTNIWDIQKDDYLEVQYAWAMIKNEKDGYNNAVQTASSVLASRKATRDFSASVTDPYNQDFMLPKSSLDGVRETVLKENNLKLDNRLELGLSNSEQLDCVGVVKRLGFAKKSEQFTAFSRICADSWINKLVENGEDLTEIKDIYKDLVTLKIATGVNGNNGIYKDFPFESEFLYESRIDATITSQNKSFSDKQEDAYAKSIVSQLKKLKQQLKPLWKKYGQPQSYGVMLLADGDKMGELLDKVTTLQQHQDISNALSVFAENVRNIMQDNRGHCIYSGGDDVLGIVPLNTAYQCADDLQKSFSEALKDVSKNLKADTPTLSVGLAICHQMTPFSVIRDYAKQAESYAKGDHIDDSNQRRNALSIVLSIRSGADIKLRLRWNDISAHNALKKWVDCYNNNDLPSKVAYAIRDIDLHTKDIAKNIAKDKQDLHTKIQSAEVKRMLKQSRTESGKELNDDDINDLTKRAEKISLAELADELIVARWLSAKTGQDLGRI